MRLRTRFAIGLSSLSLFAAGVLSVIAWRSIAAAFDAEREQSMTRERIIFHDSRALTERSLHGSLDGVEDALSRKSTPGGSALVRAALAGDAEAQQLVISTLQEQRDQRELQVLDVVRENGTVLASAHWPMSSLSRIDSSAAARAGTTGLVRIQTPSPDGSFLPDSPPVSRLALVQTRALSLGEEPGAGALLVGGVFLDDTARLLSLAGGPDAVSLTLGTGRQPVLAANDRFHDAAGEGLALIDGPRVTVLLDTHLALLASFDDTPETPRSIGIRIARVDDERLYEQRMVNVVVVVAAAMVLISVLLAALMARRFAAPIDALSSAARAVAQGDLERKVPLPSGGRHDELVALVESFNAMSGDLKDSRAKLLQNERVAAWREIAQRIAHEIKNPLTPIQMAVETTRRAHREKRKDFDEIFEESARAILEEVESLKKLVKEFSEFARLPEPVLAPDDVNETVRQTLRVFTGLPDGVTLTTDLAETLPRAPIDRAALGRALLNLVANAAEAVRGEDGASKGTVIVRTLPGSDERGAWVEIHVIDDGPGVSEEARAKIFTPYFTTKSSGTGLGLAIVQRIVIDHGGEIDVRNVLPRGADFVVRLRAA